MIDDALYLVECQGLGSHFGHSSHIAKIVMKLIRIISFCVSSPVVLDGIKRCPFSIVSSLMRLVGAIDMREEVSDQNKDINVSKGFPIFLQEVDKNS